MPFQDLVDFSGGLNTIQAPFHIAPNESVICTACEIQNGSIIATKNPLDTTLTVTGSIAKYYNAQSVIVSSAEDRFYVEWGGFLYWSNSAGTIKRYNGTTTLDIGGWTAPTVLPTATVSTTVSAQMSGSYTYCYTYMYSDIFESPASPYTAALTSSSKAIDITFTDTAPATATKRVLYRLGGVVPTFHFIAAIPVATTAYQDKVSDYQIDPSELVTLGNEPPKSGLDMLIENNGTFFASLGNKVYFSRQGTPEYWWEYNYVEIPNTITGLGKVGQSIIAFTSSEMYMISGSDINTISANKLPFQFGCAHKRSVHNMDGLLIWAATVAGKVVVCSFDGSNVNIISEKHKSMDDLGNIAESIYNGFTIEQYNNYAFTIKNSIVFNRKYMLNTNAGTFIFDFDNGFRITNNGYSPDAYLIKGTQHLAIVGTKLYDMLGSFNGNLNMKYKTGQIVNGSIIAPKSFRRVRVRGKGTFSITVIIDNISIITSSLESFYLPAEAVGTTIQFMINSTGYAEVSAISYEYEVLAL